MRFNVKEKRCWGYPIMALLYVCAAVIGITVYLTLPFSMWQKLALADLSAVAFLFIFAMILDNSSIFDPFLGFSANVMITAFAVWHEITFLAAAFMLIAALWTVKIIAGWVYTFRGLATDTRRNEILHEESGAFYPIVSLFGLHLIPAGLTYGCILPAIYVIEHGTAMTVGTFIFLLIALAAVVLQTIADVQMQGFRLDRQGNNFLRTGLWKKSRHPNYICEIVLWWAVALAAVFALGFKWYYIAGAFLNTLWFIFVRIPMAEQALAEREGYDDYKNEVGMFYTFKKKGEVTEEEPEEDEVQVLVLDETVTEKELVEAMEAPEVVLADIDYVADNDVYTGGEGVEVIGIVWPERSRRNKVYRYDPKGEKLHEGDTVLVPSRDAAKNRDIVRKVVVAHANHMVDADQIKRPLKQIIAVVKRHEEHAPAEGNE